MAHAGSSDEHGDPDALRALAEQERRLTVFENVLVVIGRGWNQYNFGEMLELAGARVIPAAKEASYERNRNLFYVACSRPKLRLAPLFTQQLSPQALATLEGWFGSDTMNSAPTA